MGFIQAVYEQGILVKNGTERNNAEYSSYLQLPMPVNKDEAKSGREIQVWLKVESAHAETLKVLGVEKLNLVEYPKVDKEKYLHREPVSPAASWRFSPIFKLGKATSNGIKELIGENEENFHREFSEWLLGEIETLSDILRQKVKDTRFYKIKNALLDDFEKESVFAPGSVNTIMLYFQSNIEKFVSEFWIDKKRSYIIVFGIYHDGKFLYPGDVPAFVNYFNKKLKKHVLGMSQSKKKSQNKQTFSCAVCGKPSNSIVSIDKLFAYATFDKANFLPGLISNTKEKIYPLCQECFSICSEGKERIKDCFRDSQTIIGLNIDIVPELVFGIDKLNRISEETGLFLHKGISGEQRRFNRLAEAGDGLVYHFLFWEQNQRQERVHLLIEDVPPTRLRNLLDDWKESNKLFYPEKNSETAITLDYLIKLLYAVLQSLAGKRDEDKNTMRDNWLKIIGELLSEQMINVYWLKSLIVSRYPSMFADQEWIRKSGRSQIKSMFMLVDFFERVNKRKVG